MNTERFHMLYNRLLPAVALAAGLLPFSGSAAAQPATCADVKAANPSAGNGEYWIVANGKTFQVYCWDMAGTPKEYLSLLNVATNYSEYPVGGARSGSTERTTYSKIRISPSTLEVDLWDGTFSTTVGKIDQWPYAFLPYASGHQCGAAANGTGKIDLTGTPFKVNDTFTVEGYAADGAATISTDAKLVSMWVNGFCSTISPTPGIWASGGYGHGVLRLAYVPFVVQASIDIQPGDVTGTIKVARNGLIPVAILTIDILSASQVDPASARFGPNQAAPVKWALEDVNLDGRLDLMLFFNAEDTGIACGQNTATLAFNSTGGQAYTGTDSIKVVDCK